MKLFHLLLAALLLGISLPLTTAQTAKPNVVYIMADDLGWGDISTHGGGVPTPNIDRLFAQGVELRNFMGWCVCSPTRAMLLTGRHPIRVGTAPEVGGELALEETTIAEGFKANGYRTGVFGKWHNGEDPNTPEFQSAFKDAFKDMPNKKHTGGHGANAHGFDEAWVYYGGGGDQFTRRTVQGRGPVSWWHNTEYRPKDEGYTDELLTQHAIEFIRGSADRPFFCYIPFQIAHAPLQAKESDLAHIDPQLAAKLPSANTKVPDKEKHTHAAMLTVLDKNVATIRTELDKLGLRENTILVFTSDNGAMEAGSSLPLRGHKHTIYDGGVRLPTVMHWPKGGLVGGKKWDGLCGALDMFPTLMAMTGSTMPPTRPLDGKNIWPALRDHQPSSVDSYYWVWRGLDAIRTDQWKLHRFFDRFELYDITKDETESKNVAEANADVVKSLTAKMDTWASSLGVALSHQAAPPKYHAPAKPEGQVLAVTVTVTDKAKPSDRLAISVANWNGSQFATDWIEYDVAFSPGTPARHPWFSTLEGNNSKPFGPLFKRGDGVDQFGRDQTTGPGIADGKSVWEHRIIGLASTAPGSLGKHGVVFTGGKPGTYTIYLDNLRIRHADGTTTSLWTNGKDTRAGKFEDNDKFKALQIKTVEASQISLKTEAPVRKTTVSIQGDDIHEGDWLITTHEVIKGRTQKVNGNIIIRDGGKLTLEDATLEVLGKFSREHQIKLEDNGTLITQRATLGGSENKGGAPVHTVILLHGGSWEAEDTTVQYSYGVNCAYDKPSRLHAVRLHAGPRPDAVIVSGQADVTLIDSDFPLAISVYAKNGGKARLDLPVKTPITRTFDSSNLPGVKYKLKLERFTVPDHWFVFVFDINQDRPPLELEFGDCPKFLASLLGHNIQSQLTLSSDLATPLKYGNLTMSRAEGTKPNISMWNVYAGGEKTDVTIKGTGFIAELMHSGGQMKITGEGDHGLQLGCTTLDLNNDAHLHLENVHLGRPLKWKPEKAKGEASINGTARLTGRHLSINNVTFHTRQTGTVMLEDVTGQLSAELREDGGKITLHSQP